MKYLALIVLACSFSIGCSNETAILLEVTRLDGSSQRDCRYLRFFIGSEDSELAINSSRTLFTGNSVLVDNIVLESGRDLLEDPYRLMLYQGETQQHPFIVAATCFDVETTPETTPVSYAVLPQPINFVADQISKWKLVLQDNHDQVEIGTTGCFDYPAKDILISSQQDGDCDEAPTDLDCDDYDALRGSGVPEICDGRDNDCNNNTSFPHLDGLCYTDEVSSSGPGGDRCFVGSRTCGEVSGASGELGTEGWGECVPVAELADGENYRSSLSSDFCEKMASDCSDTVDPFRCANNRVISEMHDCDVHFCPEGNFLKPCYTPWIDLPTDKEGDQCRWTLAPYQSYSEHWDGLEVWNPLTGVAGFFVDGCDARLKIRSDSSNPVDLAPESFVIHLNFDGTPERAIRLRLNPIVTEVCPGTSNGVGSPAISCPTLGM